jgi:predicted AAA+ superfamily ATPase
MYHRAIYSTILQRIQDQRRFIQVLAGPRQTGKTTLAHQLLQEKNISGHYASADEPTLKSLSWIEQQWEIGRLLTGKVDSPQAPVLILDEIQKINGWSESVKKLWDEDTLHDQNLHTILLGSSPLLMQKGLAESLAGRFEILPVTHWSFTEMKEAFGWTSDQYIYYGGYPGTAPLIGDNLRWLNYIRESLIETTISRDILLLTRVDKPALLRRLFELGCHYSGQVLSFTKMLGQLQEAGNTTTLSHYLDLLDAAGMLSGLPKYAGQKVRQRSSSPKLLVQNTALMSAVTGQDFNEAKNDPNLWGRLVESAVGASLYNQIRGKNMGLYYWSGRNYEVDFILNRGKSLVAIEVKSGRKRSSHPGIEKLSQEFPLTKKLLVGKGGLPVDQFLQLDPLDLFN